MESVEERKRRLYGPIRNLQVENIRKTLSKSHILLDGEYNFTSNKLKDSNYDTSYFTDYPGAVLDASGMQEPKGQLTHHFELGNDSGSLIPKETYSESTTKSDFPVKPHSKKKSKPDSYEAEKVINWPDMAPRYMVSRQIGDSEYSATYIPQSNIRGGTKVGPLYPRVDTSKLKLPLDPERFWRQRNTSIVIGSDKPDIFSENQRVYGIGKDDGKVPQLAFSKTDPNAGQKVSKAMKDLERAGHVFRYGDYNAIVGNNQTTVNDDFGPRTLPPAEHAALKLKASEKRAKEMKESGEKVDESAIYNSNLPGDNERVNHLAAYARSTTVPNVFKDAYEGRDYQTTAHFQFGSDSNTAHSIYGKDFALGAMAKRGPPQKIITPAAGQLFQNDPEFRPLAATSSQVDYASKPTPNPKNDQGKTLMDINMGLHKTDHIIMTCDQNRHWDDRQKSLAHSDYVKHSAYKPAEQITDSDMRYDFLTQHDILQHEPPENNTSEAKNNYIGTFMEGPRAVDRQKQKNKECKVRFNDNRSTHFIVGYNPEDFASETMVKFRGEGKTDKDIPPAGKTERTQPGKPKHIHLSENTQDMFAADPYCVNKTETLMAQKRHIEPEKEHAFRTSVMKADFTPLNRRKVTDTQIRTMMDCDKKVIKEIAPSHLFHSDNSGRNNYITTTMDDFIKPDEMVGQKFLLAR